MSEEQRQRQMDFILEQQARLTATVGELSDTVGKLSDTVGKLSDKVDRTADSITALLAIAEIQSGEIKELGESVRAIDERQRESEERRREGDERLNALINTVERFIEGRTGQEGDGR